MLQLQVIYGKDAGKCVRFHQSIVHIGSDPGNDFQLNDAESSQYHGEITCNHEANHYAYRDLQSDHGTRVRSANIDVMLYSHQMAQSVAIAGECMLHIGQSTLRCTYIPSPESIVPNTVQCVSSLPLHSLPPTNDPDLLSFLLDTSTTLTSKTTYQAVLKHLVIKLEQRIEKATHLAIWRYDSCRDSFSCVMERSRINQSAPSILTEDDYRKAIRMRTVSLFRSDDVTFPGCAVVAPLISSQHELGVLTVDASDSNGLQESDLEILSRVAVVAAHSLERTFINADLSEVFDGFIRSIIAVMDARDPASAGHSMRVARYAMMTAQAIHSSTRKAFINITFSSNHLDEIRFASLLHDIGKVVLRREILLKAAKLTQDDLKHLLERIDLFAAWFATQSAETMGSSYRTPQQFEHYREMVTRVQQAQAKATEDDRQLIDEMTRTFITPCPHLPLLTSQEKESLLIEHGTLNAEERQEIERHVLISWQYLSQIAWPQRWSNVPIFVLQHHEKLNGTGYPYGISGDQIVLQSRIITVCDIFDALTGGDRSYKTRHSFGDAAQILQEEAHSGALDADIVDLFVSEVIPQISDPEGSIGI
ncbi:MAG: HD domain-containing protein [Proteobacteria bacterium]|nr:HD domain-containing protein [Pseudomonadota bacterium]